MSRFEYKLKNTFQCYICPAWCIYFDRRMEPRGGLTRHYWHELLSHTSRTIDTGLRDLQFDGHNPDLLKNIQTSNIARKTVFDVRESHHENAI